MALGPDLWRLRALPDRRCGGRASSSTGSYVSLTEVSEYAAGIPEEMKQARLYPTLPPEGKTAFCFYPMSKRRGDASTTGTRSTSRSARSSCTATGRSAAPSAAGSLQLITGSTGLDDWEWGVTLFGVHPDDLKDVRLRDALRRGLGPLRRVRPVLHRHGGRRSRTCSASVLRVR